MCPFCLATMEPVVSSAASTGGLAALAGNGLATYQAGEIVAQSNERTQDVNDQGSKSKDSVRR